MSNPVGVDGAPRPGRAQLLVDLGNCLAEWERALLRGPDPSNTAWLRNFSGHLQPQLSAAGFGGIAVHLGELIRRVDAGGVAGNPREPLRALKDLLHQARQSLSWDEQSLLTRMASTPQGVPAAGAGPSGAAPMVGSQAPVPPSAARIESAQPALRPLNAPQRMARTLFGLRAFGARSNQDNSASAPLRSGSSSAPPQGGLLRLERRSGPLDPQALGGHGLPDPATPWGSHIQPQSGAARGRARNVKELLGGIAPSRRARSGNETIVKPGLYGASPKRATGWHIGAMAAFAVLLGLGAVATLVVFLMRRADASDRQQVVRASASSPSAKAAPSSAVAALPHTRLLDEDETLSALLTQVHGRGKESSELQALVDEQAAVAARALSQPKCDDASTSCAEWTKMRASLLGRNGIQRIKRRAAPGSAGRSPSSWLVGLKLPQIPIEDDPRVQRSLEYYTEKPVGRELFQTMLFRCGAYRELIESALVRHGLPVDLLALVFAESGCEPQAVSPVGAGGLWQLMPDTARAYHLRVKKGVIDERRSAPKSTEAAVRYLRDLSEKMAAYHSKGVWDLVLGSYNMGPFAMATRVERAGGDVGFWDLVDAAQIPDETLQFVPTIQALAIVLNNLPRYRFDDVQLRAPQLTSDLEAPPGTRLSLIARAASTSVDRIRTLNLDISSDRTPDLPNFAVQVPKDVVWQARDTLKGLIASGDESDLCVPQDFDWGRQHFTKGMAEACKRKHGVEKARAKAPTESGASAPATRAPTPAPARAPAPARTPTRTPPPTRIPAPIPGPTPTPIPVPTPWGN